MTLESCFQIALGQKKKKKGKEKKWGEGFGLSKT